MCNNISETESPESKKPRNFMSNPFDGLSTTEALEKAKVELKDIELISFSQLEHFIFPINDCLTILNACEYSPSSSSPPVWTW